MDQLLAMRVFVYRRSWHVRQGGRLTEYSKATVTKLVQNREPIWGSSCCSEPRGG